MKKLACLVSLALLPGATIWATLAQAQGDRGVRVTRSCSARSTVNLKVKREDSRLETEVEVDANRVGQRWRVLLALNGRAAGSAIRRTRPPSGSFELRRLLRDGPGTDRVLARARNLSSGERCRASVTI